MDNTTPHPKYSTLPKVRAWHGACNTRFPRPSIARAAFLGLPLQKPRPELRERLLAPHGIRVEEFRFERGSAGRPMEGRHGEAETAV